MKRVLATVVLSAGVVNRVAMAEQLLEAIRASGSAGIYSIETDTEGGSLVPQKDEDWRFVIVFEVTVTSNLKVTSRLGLPPQPKKPNGHEQ